MFTFKNLTLDTIPVHKKRTGLIYFHWVKEQMTRWFCSWLYPQCLKQEVVNRRHSETFDFLLLWTFKQLCLSQGPIIMEDEIREYVKYANKKIWQNVYIDVEAGLMRDCHTIFCTFWSLILIAIWITIHS